MGFIKLLKKMKGGGILSFLLIAIIGFQCILADEKCEVISNHTINGIEYRECKDGRFFKIKKFIFYKFFKNLFLLKC